MKTTIHIQDHMSSLISTREAVRNLMNEILDRSYSKEFILDFSNIHFISRASAHEIVKWECEKDLAFELTHTNRNIIEIFNVVKRCRLGRKDNYDDIPINYLKKKYELEEFLKVI